MSLTTTQRAPGPASVEPTGEPAQRYGDWAICCSGGGIRSATYCLGGLQSLDERGLLGKAKWIVGVSGGSYIAASRALVAHHLAKAKAKAEDADKAEAPDQAKDADTAEDGDKPRDTRHAY